MKNRKKLAGGVFFWQTTYQYSKSQMAH